MIRVTTLTGAMLALVVSNAAWSQTRLTPTADTYTQSGTPTQNYGSAATLLTRIADAEGLTRASYLQFNLSGLPANIGAARLRVYGRHDAPSGSGIAVSAFSSGSTATWNETQVNYNNAVSVTGVTLSGDSVIATTNVGITAGYVEWDVTAYINQRRSVGNATIGLAVRTAHQYRVTFNSSEATANRPELVITAGTGWTPSCAPSNPSYVPRAGLNDNFTSDGTRRQFHIFPAATTFTGPRPVFVALTGTVETETAFVSNSRWNQMAAEGWIVMAPVRLCTTRQHTCQTPTTQDTRIWEPWFAASRAAQYATDPGPDVRFVESAVRCMATRFNVDQRRIYTGGISDGGTFANRNIIFNSDFFAGAVPASGEWYRTDGRPITETVPSPTTIVTGYCCQRPLPTMDASIVVTVWGGPNDRYLPAPGPLLAYYNPTTKLAANYYNSQSNVVSVACSHSQGHVWPRDINFTRYVARVLASHPKGTPRSAFQLPPAPSGYSCRVGTYTDH